MAPGTYNGTVTITPTNGRARGGHSGSAHGDGGPDRDGQSHQHQPELPEQRRVGNHEHAGADPYADESRDNAPRFPDFAGVGSRPGWLALSNTNGTIPANGSAQVTVSYLTSNNLRRDTYNGSLTIFMPNAANRQLTVPVRLLVANTPLSTFPAQPGVHVSTRRRAARVQDCARTSSAVAADATSGQMPMILSATTASGR